MYPAEATPGIEPGYRVLQTLASPLGHVAETSVNKRAAETALRADDRIRTGDLNLGKVALYQLSYARIFDSLAGALRFELRSTVLETVMLAIDTIPL